MQHISRVLHYMGKGSLGPAEAGVSANQSASFTSLRSLLRRLEISLNSEKDFEQLSWQLVSILSKIESPDAVMNTVEQISECVAPLASLREEDDGMDVDSASSTLVRSSLLGVFVRSFLLAVNRLLFDGLSRLFDDVQQYLEQFREDMEKDKKVSREEEEKDSSVDLIGSPTSQNLWNESKTEDDELLLSPIHSGNATPSHSVPLARNLMTPAATKTGSEIVAGKLLTAEAVREVNDPAAWSNDQLNYLLSDMIHEMEGSPHNQERPINEADGFQTTEEQLRELRQKMDSSNPNVLYVRYLSFLRDRDYQGALDSLHQYHDVLSPEQDFRLSGNASSDDAGSASSTANLHFRGSGTQYAALNSAGLHIKFDHYTAAQESIQEAIRVAQHHGDHICVAFALAWLIRINQKTGKSKDAVLRLVSSCMNRAQELRLPALQVLATLTEVESEMVRGSADGLESLGYAVQLVPHTFAARAPAPRPLHIWSRLHETIESIASIVTPISNLPTNGTRAMVALQTQGAAVSASDQLGGYGMDWIKSTEVILDTVWKLSGKVTMSAAAGCCMFGLRSLNHVFSRIHLLCYEDSASSGEIALTVSQMAISNLTQMKTEEPVYLRALNCLVDAAVTGDNSFGRHYLLNDITYQHTLHELFFWWSLHRGEILRAEVHLNAILALSPEEKDFPAYLEALMLKAELLATLSDYPRSLELLESLEATCCKHGFAYLHAQVLISISRTRVQASSPHAPFASLNVLLKSLDICRSHHFDLLLAEAHVVMADIYIAMGRLQDAYSLINDQMPLVMEHGTSKLRGECLLLLAKTMIASIKRSKEGTEELTSAASKAIEFLQSSAKTFSLLQNLRSGYKFSPV
ncbi:unnamed protein product [Phytophthora fragariaefolia]|uniref:Anaphase-promoting complex subunit 5 n=1 Tax=Phytophthora fragariaefolia TaxID=1490495 RepID=A0A9W6X069_9STRA|nr:unnamed protein product [Phytophthora fragariaefolia]